MYYITIDPYCNVFYNRQLMVQICGNAKGTKDYSSNEVTHLNNIFAKCRQTARLLDFEEIDTSCLERMDTIKNMYGEEFDKLVYTLNSDENQSEESMEKLLPIINVIFNNSLSLLSRRVPLYTSQKDRE